MELNVSYPSRVNHTFRSTRGTRRVHDEQRMIKRKLLKFQLGKLVGLTTSRSQEIIYKYTAEMNETEE